MRRAEIIGHLGDHAEQKVTQSGTTVVNFSVAANGSRKEDATLWVRCALFGKRGESLKQFLEKGKLVYVRGELSVRQWEKDGKSGISTEIMVDEIELLGGGSDKREPRAPAPAQNTSRAPF